MTQRDGSRWRRFGRLLAEYWRETYWPGLKLGWLLWAGVALVLFAVVSE